ncbi:MAG: M50 family metallopeptidase [Sphingomonadaceae bacterium]|nr:M50 family metallopeptidase [Sphingomonadaceae bacterium]
MTLAQPGFLSQALHFVVVIGIIVTIHEFGHYLAGRLFGVKADAFSVGFGRELFGWTDRRGTRWRLSALPLGGYVKFAGDGDVTGTTEGDVSSLSHEERQHTLQAKPLWQRAIIVAAGPVTNFAFAIAIFAGFFLMLGHPYTPAVVCGAAQGSAAADAGLARGDRIVMMNGSAVSRFEDVMGQMQLNTGQPVPIVIERAGARRALVLQPKQVTERDAFGQSYKVNRIGLAGCQRIAERVGPVGAVRWAVIEVARLVGAMWHGIGQIFAGERGLSELGGPLKVAQMSGQAAQIGWERFVQFLALISINIGFINLLPVPVLDGGHLLLYAVEGLRRRPLSQRAQELAFLSGFAAILTLMVVLTWNDLSSFGVWQRLVG